MPKTHCSYMIEKDVVDKIETLYKSNGCKTKSDFVEKAVEFYYGYIAAESYRDYVSKVLISTIQGTLDSFENRMASLLFKMSVEIAMLEYFHGLAYDLDDLRLEEIRVDCVKQIKSIRGVLPFEKIIDITRDKYLS